MERRYSLQVALVALGISASGLRYSEGFRTQRPDDITLNVALGFGSMVETKWGSQNQAIPGTQAEGGSSELVFVETMEQSTTEQVRIATAGTCGAANRGLNETSSASILTLTNITAESECEQICEETPNCGAAQYTRKRSTCALLKKLTGTIVEIKGTSIVLPNCGSDCLHEGKKLNGTGTSLGKAPNANFCQALCASDSACNGFTFVKSTQECLAFHDNTDSTADENAVSGPKAGCNSQAQTTKYTGTCTIDNRTGHDKGEIDVVYNVSTYEDCRQLCLKNPKCKFLTHNKPDRICYLKARMGKIIFVKPGDTTGPKLCDGSCFLKDIELTGWFPLKKIKYCLSAHFCQYECSMKSSCAMWSYGERSKACVLFKKSAEQKGRRSSGFWAGPSTPCPQDAIYASSASSCALRGVRFGNGAPLAVTTEESPAKCHDACQQSTVCEAYTYDLQQKKCELFLASAERRREENPNFISGPRLCSDACSQQNTAYVGPTIQQFLNSIETPEECQLRCQATTSCTYWSFQASKKLCRLLRSDRSRAATGVVGGPKYCTESCDIRGYSLSGLGWKERLYTLNAGLCREECSRQKECFVAVFSERCYLFDENVHYKQDTNAQIMFRSCSNCFRHGVGYKLLDAVVLWSTEALNAEECRQRCSLMERCTRFSYNAKTKACSLLSGESQDVKGTNLISGPASCSRNTSCYQKNVAYEGGQKTVQKARTTEQCQQLCEKRPTCRVFSHYTRAGKCYLWSGDNLRLQPLANWISGSKKCVSLGNQLCAEPSKEYSGSNLYSTPVSCDSEICCRNACVNDPRCKTWTWNRPSRSCWLKGLEAFLTGLTEISTHSGARQGCPHCFAYGEKYGGTALETFKVSTPALCQLRCQVRNDCNAFTYGPSQTCKLYANTGSVKQTYLTGFFSGPREC